MCVKEANFVIPIVRHSGKRETMETVKGGVVSRVWGEGDGQAEHRGFLGSETNLYDR